jgi:hypothetical protein
LWKKRCCDTLARIDMTLTYIYSFFTTAFVF